jgi:hypothetical protein
MTSCIICCDDFSAVRNQSVKCPYCDFSACRKCCQRYITDEHIAKCMNTSCDKEWTRKFLVENFPKTFVNKDWKNIREKVCYDREKAMLPATQGIAEQRIESERIKEDIRNVDKMIRDLYERRRNLEHEFRQGGNVNIAQERRNFVRACPAEDCRGFLSSAWKCGICSKWSCPECHVIKGDRQDCQHTCNKDELETAKLLDKDTKSCPKCATSIYKIEGCDQMWCTQCHTAFSWRSGRIETHIHNPHFYEWQRRTNGGQAPRVVGDVVCGREIDQMTPNRIWNDLAPKITEADNYSGRQSAHVSLLARRIGRTCETILHLERVQLDTYRANQLEDNLELRVEFLMNQISEEEFKMKVQRANKANEKKREIGNVLQLFVQTVTDIIYRVHERATTARVVANGNGNNNDSKVELRDQVNEILDEVEAIRAYSNECLESIGTTYGSKKKWLTVYDHNPLYQTGTRDVLH